MRLRGALLLGLTLAAACAPVPTAARFRLEPAHAADSLDAVVERAFTTWNFRLQSGRVLPELTLAFETYGRLAPDGRNAILVTHGFSSSHHAAGRHGRDDPSPGWWNTLIGPGKPIDTDRHLVVSSNMLGSSYGSTGPRSLDPATGRPYGPAFPDLTLHDIVAAQKALLDALGVRRLVAVAGPSFGGYQAFQWAVSYPDFVLGVVPALTAPWGARGRSAEAMIRAFARDPAWNDGWHYERGGIPGTMARMRIVTLRRYGAEPLLTRLGLDGPARETRLREMAEAWAREFDPNSMVVLRRAGQRFDARPEFPRIRAKVLYVLSRTDRLFPPALAPDVMARLAAAGVDARYVEIDSDLGHLASGPDARLWAPALGEFLAALAP